MVILVRNKGTRTRFLEDLFVTLTRSVRERTSTSAAPKSSTDVGCSSKTCIGRTCAFTVTVWLFEGSRTFSIDRRSSKLPGSVGLKANVTSFVSIGRTTPRSLPANRDGESCGNTGTFTRALGLVNNWWHAAILVRKSAAIDVPSMRMLSESMVREVCSAKRHGSSEQLWMITRRSRACESASFWEVFPCNIRRE